MKYKNIQHVLLALIVFCSGAIVMIVELVGSRIVAPYLGNSIYVWTSIIGVILAALSAGYYVSGRLSEKNPQLSFLGVILGISGILITLVPLLDNSVLETVQLLGPLYGSIIATFMLFVLPAFLLGFISPYAVRLASNNLETVGSVAGKLYALSTVGSIVGTFLAGFFLIPRFGSTAILCFVGVALTVLGCLVHRKILGVAMIVLAVIISSVALSATNQYVYEHDSAYSHIRVVDFYDENNTPARALLLATESHSLYYPNEPTKLFSPYSQAYRLDELFIDNPTKALTLGGGAYITPRDFIYRFPDAHMSVVEIDPQVTQVAEEYFDFNNSESYTVVHADGRIFLNTNTEKYDVVYGDAYASYFGVPFQLTTIEAYQKMYSLLDDDGIAVLNIISALEGEGSWFLNSQIKTLSAVFEDIFVFPTRDTEKYSATEPQNVIVIATKQSVDASLSELRERVGLEQQQFIDNSDNFTPSPEIGTILTDDYAPTDFYAAKYL